MSKLRRIISNTVLSLLGQVVTWISTILLTIAYGRFLDDVKFGELYFAITFVSLLGIPIDAGYNSQIIRGVAQAPNQALRYLSNIFVIKLSIWFIVYALTLLISWLLGYSTEVRILVGICGLTLLISGITNTFASLHYAFERTLFPTIGNILEKGLSAFVGFLILRNGMGIQPMAWVMLGGALINGIWQAPWFFRSIKFHLAIDLAFIRELAIANIPFLIYGILSVGYYNIDTVILSIMTNNEVVGWYGAGYRLFNTLSFLPNLVITIVYPISSKLSLSSDKSLKQAVEKAMNFVLFCGMPIAVGMIVVAPNIIGFLYHRPEYVHTIPAFQALAPGMIFLYINMVLGILILAKKQDKKIPIMAAVALVFNVGINLVLIPLYQHVGAAIVTSLTEVLLFCMAITIIPRQLLPVGSLKVGVKALIASLVMALAILPMRSFNLFAILPVAALVYFVASLFLRTIPNEDIKAIYGAISYRRALEPIHSPSVNQVPETPLPLSTQVDGLIEDVLATTMKLPKIRRLSQEPQAAKQQEQVVSISMNEVRIEERLVTSNLLNCSISSYEHLFRGYRCQLAGSYDEAMQEYRFILNDTSESELLDEVISNVRALLKLEPEYMAGYAVLHDAYIGRGEYRRATEVRTKALTVTNKEHSQIYEIP